MKDFHFSKQRIIEVVPDKKVVWALREWTDPDLGPASCIQLLDERGKEENGDLQRRGSIFLIQDAERLATNAKNSSRQLDWWLQQF